MIWKCYFVMCHHCQTTFRSLPRYQDFFLKFSTLHSRVVWGISYISGAFSFVALVAIHLGQYCSTVVSSHELRLDCCCCCCCCNSSFYSSSESKRKIKHLHFESKLMKYKQLHSTSQTAQRYILHLTDVSIVYINLIK